MRSVTDIKLKVVILMIDMSGVRLTELGRAKWYVKLLGVVMGKFALGFGRPLIEGETAIFLVLLLGIVVGWGVVVGAA